MPQNDPNELELDVLKRHRPAEELTRLHDVDVDYVAKWSP